MVSREIFSVKKSDGPALTPAVFHSFLLEGGEMKAAVYCTPTGNRTRIKGLGNLRSIH